MKHRKIQLTIALLLGGLITAVTLAALFNNSANAAPVAPVYPDQIEAVDTAVGWLLSKQNDDGGYTTFGPDSTVPATLDAIIALGSAGYAPHEAVGYLQNNISATAAFAITDGGAAGKVILALTTVNEDPYAFGGYNFVISATRQLSTSGQYAGNPFKHSLAMLGLTAVSQTVPVTATQWLLDQQAADGSWDDGFGTLRNPDATSMAVMALIANGATVSDTAVVSAAAFLSDSQLATGGWEYGVGFGENANSTAMALQALSAMGEDFYDDGGAWAKNGISPLTALLNWQNGSGAFQADFGAGRFDNLYATVQAIPAATGKPYPLPARYEAARRAVACLDAIQEPTTGGWNQFGDFPGFPASPNAGGTARAIQAIAAFGDDPQADRWTTGGVTNAVQALQNLTPAYLAGGRGGRVGIVVQGVVAAGAPYSVANFSGYNLPISITGYLSPTGEYANTNFGPTAHAEAMLGLSAAGEMVDPTAVTWLLNAQTDGNWGDPDKNGIAFQALGYMNPVSEAMAQLRTTQLNDGGWNSYGTDSNPSSSAEAAQGLAALGENPFGTGWSKVENGRIVNAADAAMAQQADNGCWSNAAGADPFSTTDAIMLLTAVPQRLHRLYLPVVLSE